MSVNTVEKIDDNVKIKNLLVSVSDKKGIDKFIPELFNINPDIKIFSTGGTYAKIKDILPGPAQSCLIKVSDYTGQPETQGGLVKTLDFKIYLGLLTEKYNSCHMEDLKRTGAFLIDMVVVNLYPSEQTVKRTGVTPEEARGNIDIGGPCMIRAAAKNFLRVAPVVDPLDYEKITAVMKAADGRIPLKLRFALAQKAFEHTAAYDRNIADYLKPQSFADITSCYREIKNG